jgi:hypothetical protein
MAEFRSPRVTSKRSNVAIDHDREVDETIVVYTQELRIEGDLPTAAIYRLMASADQGMVVRFSKAAIKNLPALPPQALQPTHWDGQTVPPPAGAS